MESLPAVAPVAPDVEGFHALAVNHLAIELANKSVELAHIKARVSLVLQLYGALHIDTWIRQVVHQPSANDGQMLQIEGPIVIPPQDHEVLSRFLAAVEGLG